MTEQFNLPSYNRFTYTLSTKTGCYIQKNKPPANNVGAALPYELKRDISQAMEIRCYAKEVLAIPQPKKLLSELRETLWHNWYAGDKLQRNNGVKIRSMMLVHFTTDCSVMNIFLFNDFYPRTDQQQSCFTSNAIPLMLKEYFM
jgi:hypothetical protein